MSQFYFATVTSTNNNMVTLATLLTAPLKTEPIRQMKRKPDQLQSKLTGSSSNNNF